MGITEEIVERSKKTEHGFRDLQSIADGLVTSGDAAFAKTLIEESGEPMPELTYQFPISPANEKAAASIKASSSTPGA